MTPQDRVGETPLLDEWCSEIGDDAVLEAVTKARQDIVEGKTLGFSDKGEFLKHLGREHRQTA